ncbi:MAG: MBL fold metallo-hydrolase [Desulfarculaceae bacterium]|nr:MBL fold metallo-hydrolase [Desulfarculaceae bacterium]MCF8071273.1 MBL fold metallo-hydrolase [Desulfarculaceae bacterium]MCF8101124.1 MBL fold metallo-hydrolase [Desulfarculaceae bacterium]MCF8115327.1 MBL fold metallo-hydrolase [Desulfarculaceae bacterium]
MKVIQMLVGQMAVFAYLVGCEKTGEAVVIDPAGNEEEIVKRAEEEGLKIVKIVNTHAHPDHTCGNAKLKALTGAPIVIHSADAEAMVSPHSLDFARMLGCTEIPRADETVEDGDVITAGEEVALKVLSTPGHSDGGVCLYTPGHVFTGDTLFVGGVGRTDLPGGSLSKMLASIKNQVLTLPDDTVVWPGHHYGPASRSTVKQERETNEFLR